VPILFQILFWFLVIRVISRLVLSYVKKQSCLFELLKVFQLDTVLLDILTRANAQESSNYLFKNKDNNSERNLDVGKMLKYKSGKVVLKSKTGGVRYLKCWEKNTLICYWIFIYPEIKTIFSILTCFFFLFWTNRLMIMILKQHFENSTRTGFREFFLEAQHY